VLGFGRVLRRVQVLDRELEQHAHDLVLHGAEPLGATPPVPVGNEQALDGRAPVREFGPQVAGDRQPQLPLAAGMDFAEAFEFRRDGSGIEDFSCERRLGQGQHGFIGIAKRKQHVIGKASQCGRRGRSRGGAELKIIPIRTAKGR
jgi:hypothetical protein